MKVNLQRIINLLQDFKQFGNGRIGSCTYIKKDGSRRTIQFRFDVKSYLKGGLLGYNPSDYGLMIVCDMQIASDNKKNGTNNSPYRSINLNTIESLSINGITYEVEKDDVLEAV